MTNTLSHQAWQSSATLTLGMLLAGCATPSVTYKDITGAAAEVADVYVLNAARITITPAKPASAPAKAQAGTAAAATPASPPTVTASLVEHSGHRIGVVPTNNVWTTTRVSIAKVDNTDRVDNIGVETTDNAKSFVTAVGGLAVQAITAAAAASPSSCTYSSTTEFSFPLKLGKNEHEHTYTPEGMPGDSCLKVEIGPKPIDAVPFDQMPRGAKTNRYFYSACRDVTIKLNLGGSQPNIERKFRLPDPNYLQSVEFPYKGTIKMHSLCGVSVTATGSANPMAGIELATEVLKQVEAVRAASDQ